MPYIVKDEVKPGTDEIEYVVVSSSSGIPVPPPNRYRLQSEALARVAALEKQDLELIAEWKAVAPKPGQRCIGPVEAATAEVVIQDIGRKAYVFHWRAKSVVLTNVKVGDSIDVLDGRDMNPGRDGPDLSR